MEEHDNDVTALTRPPEAIIEDTLTVSEQSVEALVSTVGSTADDAPKTIGRYCADTIGLAGDARIAGSQRTRVGSLALLFSAEISRDAKRSPGHH
ncbi:MAG: hypothetical protein AB1Z98_15940 [Nannocystaceae bacterium]